MSRAGALTCVIFVVALALASAGVSSGSVLEPARASGEQNAANSVTYHSATAPRETLWLRLRWIIAGVATGVVLLVTLRQLRMMAAPRVLTTTSIDNAGADLAQTRSEALGIEGFYRTQDAVSGD